MRKLIIAALLFNISPFPVVAASFSEGKFVPEPVVRAVPGLTPAQVPDLKTPGLQQTTLTVPELQVPNISALPGAELDQPEARLQDPAQPQTAPELPGLEKVEAKLNPASEGGLVSPQDAAAQEHALDYTYDRWADDGGALHLPAAVDEGEGSVHSSPLRRVEENREEAPVQPPAAPAAPAQKPTPRWYSVFPNMLTTGNLWSGLAGAYFASQGMIVPAVVAIIAANVFDALDGRTARALGVKNPLGIDYDSLADVVSFGIAPALLVFKAVLLPTLGVWGFPIAAAFASAGWFRLSRFNVGAHAEEAGTVPHKKSDSFTGLPIPGGAGVIAAAVLALAGVSASIAAPAAAVITLIAAAAMASRLPYPAFKKGGAKALILPAAVGLTAVVPLAVLGLYSFIPAAIFGLYLTTGPLIWLWQGGSPAWRTELKRKAFHQLTLLYIPAFYLLGPKLIVPAVAALLALEGTIEYLRLKVPAARPFFERWFGKIIREKEADRLSGSFYVALGVGAVMAAVTLLHLNPLIVPAAVLALALGDAASPLVGLRFGFKPYKAMGTQRSVDGTVAGFAVALSIGLALGFPWLAALGAAAVFSAVDTLPVKPDDNLWIPVAYAAALALLSLL